MIQLGLIGHPIGASLSPALHAEAARLTGVDARYALYPTPPGTLDARLAELAEARVRGFNVTAPYKSPVAAWVHTVGPTAARLGVVNTVIFGPDGARHGANTDLEGVAWALGPVDGAIATVIGAGGAARAVVAALADGGARAVRVVARRLGQAQGLAAELGGANATGHALDGLAHCLAAAEIIVTCLPAAAAGVVLAAPIQGAAPSARLMDLGYGEAAGRIVERARGAGLVAQDGLPMLAAQGVAAFSAWTGRRPPVGPVLDRLRRVRADRRAEAPPPGRRGD